MQDILVTDILPPLKIGATGMEAIQQNIAVIVTTLAFSVPLDRSFASQGSYLDSPAPYVTARRIAELTDIIEAKEPRVKVISITYEHWQDDLMQGRVYPKIRFRLKDGVIV